MFAYTVRMWLSLVLRLRTEIFVLQRWQSLCLLGVRCGRWKFIHVVRCVWGRGIPVAINFPPCGYVIAGTWHMPRRPIQLARQCRESRYNPHGVNHYSLRGMVSRSRLDDSTSLHRSASSTDNPLPHVCNMYWIYAPGRTRTVKYEF